MFACDLDRTLIHSKRYIIGQESLVCVDKKEDHEIAFMKEEDYNFLEELLPYLVPITGRSMTQYQRISFLQNQKYAITTFGGIILKNGKPMNVWDARLNLTFGEYIDVISYLTQDSLYADYLKDGFHMRDDRVIVFPVTGMNQNFKELFKTHSAETLRSAFQFQYCFEKNRLFLFPNRMSKETALHFLIEMEKPSILITAGDSYVDEKFVKMGNLRFIPRNTELYETLKNEKGYIFLPDGMDGVHPMLRIAREGLI